MFTEIAKLINPDYLAALIALGMALIGFIALRGVSVKKGDIEIRIGGNTTNQTKQND